MARRLAAIMAADMVGFSRLMAADENGTIKRQKAHRQALIDPKIDQFGGRIVNTTGDGLLVEFPSVVDAVQCAVEIQQAMPERERETPEDRRIRYRIGVNLGDIVIDGEGILGDGVNVAARLEGLAEPGGLCISDNVHQYLEGKIPLAFTDLGEQALKNLPRPLRIWGWSPEAPSASESGARREAGSSPNLPDKPSIAVLPFTNMSGDPEQDYFSDGITEDIITELSRFKKLFVIARNSTFAFKGQSVNVGDIGAKLGVRYIVEGSVRKAGHRVRVTAQLVEAATGNHLWAERYDRDLDDIFDVQDELVSEIAAAVPGQIEAAAIARARRQPIKSMTAYDWVLRGEWYMNRSLASTEAKNLFQKAIDVDPECARAHMSLAVYHAYSVFAQGVAVQAAAERSRTFAERALDIDPSDPAIQATAALAYLLVGEHELARQHSERAIKLNPNDYAGMQSQGVVLGYLGKTAEGLQCKERMLRHDPVSGDSHREGFLDLNYMSHRYEDAIKAFSGWRDPPPHIYLELSAVYAQLGRMNDAKNALVQLDRLKPEGFEIAEVVRAHVRMCAREEDREHWLEGYRKAGVQV